jgi:hypothetical protein
MRLTRRARNSAPRNASMEIAIDYRIRAEPMRPSAAWMFWLCTVATTSAGVGLSAVNRSGSSRSRSG